MLQKPQPPGTCPPPAGAGKGHYTKCAKWVRRTYLLGMSWLSFNYYVFEIRDKTGKPTAYYDDFVRFANENTRDYANLSAQEEFEIIPQKGPYGKPYTSFVGPLDPYSGQDIIPPDCQVDGVPTAKQNMFTLAVILCLV